MARKKGKKRRAVKSGKQQEYYVPNEQELEAALQISTWGKDGLSHLIQDAYKNIKISYVKAKPYVELFERIIDAFTKAHEQIGYSNYGELLLCSFFNRAFSNFVASARLLLSCQVIDSFSTLRSCLENSLYARYVKSNPALQSIYQNRHISEQAKKEMRRKFQVNSLFQCLKAADKRLEKETHDLYDMCIDYGAHPNERGAIPNIRISTSGVSMVILNADEPFVKGCFCAAVKVGKCVLSIFNLVYSEDFEKVNMSLRIQNIEKNFNPIALTTAQMMRSLAK